MATIASKPSCASFLPLSLPGIISTIVFTFTLTLHEFIYGLVFIADTSQRTLSVGVPTELILGDVYFLAAAARR